jgi:hypothetical protein
MRLQLNFCSLVDIIVLTIFGLMDYDVPLSIIGKR